MRQSFSVLVCVLLATAAYAQDVDFGAFADPGSLLGPAPAAARGTAPARGAPTTAPRPDRLVRLRDVLAKAEAPLAKEQETELNKLLDEAIPAMQRTIQTHGREMMASTHRLFSEPPRRKCRNASGGTRYSCESLKLEERDCRSCPVESSLWLIPELARSRQHLLMLSLAQAFVSLHIFWW